jgi:hypothetical protein
MSFYLPQSNQIQQHFGKIFSPLFNQREWQGDPHVAYYTYAMRGIASLPKHMLAVSPQTEKKSDIPYCTQEGLSINYIDGG